MEKLFLSYKLSLFAKEKGFVIPHDEQLAYYADVFDNKLVFGKDIDFSRVLAAEKSITIAPLYQQILDWFREKHKIEIQPFQLSKTQAAYGITFIETYPEKYNDKDMYEYTNTTQILDEIEFKEKRNIKIPSAKEIAKNNYSYYEALNQAIEEAFKLIK